MAPSKLALVAAVVATGLCAAAGQTCRGTPPATDAWCEANCFHTPPNCPADLCQCGPGPSPSPSPTPTPTPTPPPPSPSPSPSPTPSSGVYGFWFGYAGSASPNPAPSNGWLFSFPGLVVSPPFTAGGGSIPENPSWGHYDRKILTQGGGGSSWGDSVYSQLKGSLSQYRSAGWDGVCWDWEMVSGDHTTNGFNDFMRAVKDAGLVNIVTSTAEGPYQWSASTDATGIDWSLVDYFVPQMYGAAGTLPSGWQDYANYWVSGAGKPNVHGVTFRAPPMSKILWGMPAGTCGQASQFGGAGCVEWDYNPNIHPGSTLVVM